MKSIRFIAIFMTVAMVAAVGVDDPRIPSGQPVGPAKQRFTREEIEKITGIKRKPEASLRTLAPVTPPEIVASTICADYHMFHLIVNVDWGDAYDGCMRLGGALASVHTADDFVRIRDMLIAYQPSVGGAYFGLFNWAISEDLTDFIWIYENTAGNTDELSIHWGANFWAPFEPNFYPGLPFPEACVEFTEESHWFWNDVMCGETQGAICQTPCDWYYMEY